MTHKSKNSQLTICGIGRDRVVKTRGKIAHKWAIVNCPDCLAKYVKESADAGPSV